MLNTTKYWKEGADWINLRIEEDLFVFTQYQEEYEPMIHYRSTSGYEGFLTLRHFSRTDDYRIVNAAIRSLLFGIKTDFCVSSFCVSIPGETPMLYICTENIFYMEMFVFVPSILGAPPVLQHSCKLVDTKTDGRFMHLLHEIAGIN